MSKTIKAVFGVGEYAKTCPQWQYDYNTTLQFVGLDLPANYEVDLSNSKTGQSTTVLGDENGCVIPAQYFIPGSSIFAWVFVTGNDFGFTRAQVEIPISPRAQHTGDPPTPEQQDALDAAIALLNETVEGIPTAIDTALAEAKESGEFDGADGNNAWTIDAENTRIVGNYIQCSLAYLVGPSGTTVKAGDIVFISDGRFTQVNRLFGVRADTTLIGDLHGADGAPGADGEQGIQGPPGWDGNVSWTIDAQYVHDISGIKFESAQIVGPDGFELREGDIVYISDGRYGVVEQVLTPLSKLTIVGDIHGATGATGADGTTFTPAVSSAGVISWTNDGGKQNPPAVDIVSAVLAALPTWEGGSF